MNKKSNVQYQKIADWFRQRPAAIKGLKLGYIWLPRLIEVSYPVLLFLAWQQNWNTVLRYIIIPAVVFGVVTVMRHIWDFPRPYEQGRVPLIEKEKKGHSFPSRHVASAAVIAWVWWDYAVIPGGLLAVCTVLIALTRVLAGVHYLKDVAAGGLLALLLAFGMNLLF